jgi:hypothetical protein
MVAQQATPLKTSSSGNQMDFIRELYTFLKVNKKLWMLPIILVMVVLGGLLVLAQGSVLAPFIYTLF